MGIPKYCDIKVPAEYLQDYKDAFGPDYKYISAWNPNESGDDDKPVTPCATPSIFYGAGKLKFSCETAGAKYHYTISDKDMATDALSEDGNVSLSAAYDISVYATADGYSASEKAKATLYWVNANLENTTNINQARTRGVVASAHDGIVCISGLDNGEVVKFYAADGKLIGSSTAVDGTASCAVSETMVIAKFGNNAIKVAVKQTIVDSKNKEFDALETVRQTLFPNIPFYKQHIAKHKISIATATDVAHPFLGF